MPLHTHCFLFFIVRNLISQLMRFEVHGSTAEDIKSSGM